MGNSIKCFSFTSCIIDTKNKLILLEYMLESVLKLGVIPHISLSYANNFTYKEKEKEQINKTLEDIVNKLETKYDVKIVLYKQNGEWFQFDHLCYLFKEFQNNGGSEIDKILFINDTDVLLELPNIDTNKIIPGYVYFPVESHIITSLNDIDEIIINKDKLLCEKLIDFSGSICSYNDIKKYFMNIWPTYKNRYDVATGDFKQLNKIMISMEDIHFMKYLDNNYEYFAPSKPFIFHIKTNNKDDTWKQTILKHT